MKIFEFGEFKAEIDSMDLDFSEKYEECLKVAEKTLKEVPEDATHLDYIRANCHSAFNLFDTLFGAGTSNKMYGKKTNARICDDSLVKLALTIDEDKNEYVKSTKEKTRELTNKRK